MNSTRTPKSAGGPGSKLLFHAMKRNVERVERRYRDSVTREHCQAIAQLCDEALRMIGEGKRFTVFLSWQPTLIDYSESDIAYGMDD